MMLKINRAIFALKQWQEKLSLVFCPEQHRLVWKAKQEPRADEQCLPASRVTYNVHVPACTCTWKSRPDERAKLECRNCQADYFLHIQSLATAAKIQFLLLPGAYWSEIHKALTCLPFTLCTQNLTYRVVIWSCRTIRIVPLHRRQVCWCQTLKCTCMWIQSKKPQKCCLAKS